MKPQKYIWLGTWNNVVAVFGLTVLLVVIFLPGVQQAREAARRTQSKNHLKQIGLALHNYIDSWRIFPPGGVFRGDGIALHGWMTSITPYMEASPWYNGVNFNIPWDNPDQIDHFRFGYAPVYLNPSLPVCCEPDGIVRTHYSGNDRIFYRNSSTSRANLTSGTSQTIAVGDSRDHFEPFGYSYNWRSAALPLNSSPGGFGSIVRDVTHVLMADGTVRELNHATDEKVFAALRGKNSQSDTLILDISKPAEPYQVSPPIVCLWVDPKSCSSLLGFQDESQQLVRASFMNAGNPWLGTTSRTWDQQVELLKPHETLQELNLRDMLGASGLQKLEKLPNLKKLQAKGRALTNRGIELICRCKKLEYLELESASFGDAGWAALARAERLKVIKLRFQCDELIPFSAQSVVKFLEDRPDCDVIIISCGQRFELETIRELAKSGKLWPLDRRRSK